MSTRMSSASSCGPRKVTSTTYVAPCSRCAGPNTSPSKLWAIIMWSRTVTLNIGLPVQWWRSGGSVGDRVADGRQRAVGETGQHVRQLLEPRLPGEQGVERRVAEEVDGEREPLRVRDARAANCRNGTH